MQRFNENLTKAIGRILFCIGIFKMQMEAGRYCLHEHSWSAKSWDIPEMEALFKDPRLHVLYADQCHLGFKIQVSAGSDERGPAKKATGKTGNGWLVLKACMCTSHSREAEPKPWFTTLMSCVRQFAEA